MRMQRFVGGLMLMALPLAANSATPVFHHPFDDVTDASGAYKGVLNNGASLQKAGNEGYLDLGSGNGYFDFGTSLGSLFSQLTGDYSISVNLFIPEETSITANGNFIFCFSNSSSAGYAFFGAKESRYSVTLTSWSGEQTVSANQAFPKGEWVNAVIVQNGNDASVYLNGVKKQTSSISLRPKDLGATPQNWLGRSPYDGDVMLKGARYADFAIYDVALTDAEIAELAADPVFEQLNAGLHEQAVDAAIAGRNFDFSNIRNSKILLPTDFGGGVAAKWTSSNPEIISADGLVNRPAAGKGNAELTLTAELSKGTCTKSVTYPATVLSHFTDDEAVAFDLDNILLKGNLSCLRSDISLPTGSVEGSAISWTSSDESYLTSAGKLQRLADGNENHDLTLTATATRGDAKAEKEFKVSIGHLENYDSYLFVYFPSNDNENLYYALSRNGYSYTPLNNGKCVMASDTVALKKGIRDPHILRGHDGNFYMVATDMKSSEGWSSNRGMVLYKSKDLVNWEHHTVHFPSRFPEWKNVTRVWAPEVIWDANYENADGTLGRYLIYYSLLTNDGKCEYDKIYYSYANDDFSDLLTDPVYFYDRGSATIDGDIVWDDATQLYHMFFKNEGLGGICKVTAERLTPLPGQPDGSQWSTPSRTLQMTTEAVEGAGVFKMINSDAWVLMYDCYANGHYQFCESTDLEHFTLRAQTTTSGAFTPRHGTVIALTPEETARLLEAFPPSRLSPAISAAQNPAVRQDNFKAGSTSAYIPVRYGTDLKSFDPMLLPVFGAEITPSGPQDFSDGKAVEYTVTLGDATKKYSVTAAVEVNPVLPGFKADPEVLYSKKTGRFYIYPTFDGYPSWGGYQFNVYSSADLVNWQLENCILDLSTDDVTWATGNGWAPCIEEKYEDGQYRYYFYFSGHNPAVNYKTLGCAVADSPTGPFVDLGHPLIDQNITSGQLIDSDVFTDPVSGETYFYWGNGALVASRLESDMVTIKDAKVITPQGGTLSDYAFREGVYVFYREGKYYFMWSVDDTGAKNYHVAYGTSDSPMGPIKVAESPVVIKQKAKDAIYGTGHNSVVQIPGRDEWYIVYHRINKNFQNNGPGYHREVCIDRLEFNEDGTIKEVTPTHAGISPVDPNAPSGVEEIAAGDVKKGAIVETYYCDMMGVRVGARPTAAGIYIKVDRFENGSTSAMKVFVTK